MGGCLAMLQRLAAALGGEARDGEPPRPPVGYSQTAADAEDGDTRLDAGQLAFFDPLPDGRPESAETTITAEENSEDKEEHFEKVSIKKKADQKLTKGKKLKMKREKTDLE